MMGSPETLFTSGGRIIESLFRALIDVINEHGHGDGGWESARWLVYDKYAECVVGIYRHRGNNDYWYGCVVS